VFGRLKVSEVVFYPEIISVCVGACGASLPCWLVMVFIRHPVVVGCFIFIFCVHGTGFYRGALARALFHAPLVGFFFLFYEFLKVALDLERLLPGGGV
jgi:hypothetical protein